MISMLLHHNTNEELAGFNNMQSGQLCTGNFGLLTGRRAWPYLACPSTGLTCSFGTTSLGVKLTHAFLALPGTPSIMRVTRRSFSTSANRQTGCRTRAAFAQLSCRPEKLWSATKMMSGRSLVWRHLLYKASTGLCCHALQQRVHLAIGFSGMLPAMPLVALSHS